MISIPYRVAVFSLGLIISPLVHADDIKIVGIDFAPLSFHKSGGAIEGAGVDVSKQIITKLNLKPVDIAVPIDKVGGYNSDHVALFPIIIRNPDREKQGFKWVGKLHEDHYCFFTLKKNKPVNTVEEANASGVIGVNKGGATENTARKIGIKNIEIAMGNSGNARKLFADRIQGWFTGALVGMYSIKQEGLDTNAAQCTGNFGPISYWLAASKAMPDAQFEKMKNSFEAMEKDGSLAGILKKYQ